MFLGTYTDLFESSVSPWTTLGPLAVVISISLAQEGAADMKRHRSDRDTNNHPVVVLRRAEDLEEGATRDETIMDGSDVEVKLHDLAKAAQQNRKTIDVESAAPLLDTTNIAFTKIRRMDMRAGDIVLVKNRDMVPADIILLGSSGENGAAYIETSPIDGETNLKLRNVPQIPPDLSASSTPRNMGKGAKETTHPKFETIERAVKRICRMSLLGFPEGVGATRNPSNPSHMRDTFVATPRRRSTLSMIPGLSFSFSNTNTGVEENVEIKNDTRYVASITSEAPNASVNTFSGKITLPPKMKDASSMDVPLGAENILLRGAVLRNTEWALGVACFTGADTKLARNSVATPSKFSRLDLLMNRTVVVILFLMIACVSVLAILGDYEHQRKFDELWYAGYNVEGTSWPYLEEFEAPEWRTKQPPFFAFIFTFITLLNNFVPLSLYVTVEFITLMLMLFINWDKDMYHEETDTPAAARSTNITDLGQVKYVFSDKTGTLTQNVMKFKRCSVDGLIFGAPVEKVGPDLDDDDNDDIRAGSNAHHVFHPLQRLLVGSIDVSMTDDEEGGVKIEYSGKGSGKKDGFLTFNAEMFLRVMSICHTVVVEKEIDTSQIAGKSDDSVASSNVGSFFSPFKNRSRNNTMENSKQHSTRLGTVVETKEDTDNAVFSAKGTKFSLPGDSSVADSIAKSLHSETTITKGKDGAPGGFAYQAESPDEGALVEAASNEYDFQLIGRDSNGVKISCSSPSLLTIPEITRGLNSGRLSAKEIASVTAKPTVGSDSNELKNTIKTAESRLGTQFIGTSSETWQVLAVNKFDSDRKRMSVLVRAPESMGSIPILMCKGADSSMLDPKVCEGGDNIFSGETLGNSMSIKEEPGPGDEWESSALVNMQSHLGVFASEGLRTLVLGVRFLTESECSSWLQQYEVASTSITDRKNLLRKAAYDIETKLHIVGSTAIEDKLQDGVPDTIYNIGKAGIRLWVLTGDKRETAIEIGYSTKVLTPNMHLTDVADGSEKRVKALVAMEFMRLVKLGKLPQYQKDALNQTAKSNPITCFCGCLKAFGKLWRGFSRNRRRLYYMIAGLFFKDYSKRELKKIVEEKKQELLMESKAREVRRLAEKLLDDYLESREGANELRHARRNSADAGEIDFDGGPNTVPTVFTRASSARASMDVQNNTLSEAALRSITLGSMTADSLSSRGVVDRVVDEDTLSMQSFVPGKSAAPEKIFNKKKRTLLEKMFAVDRDVRKGNLVKHLTKEKKAEYYSNFNILPQDSRDNANPLAGGSRALVIEGSALAHFLENKLLEELLFSVASNCESVIACRVSPKQKALLVKLVKQFVQPEPVTLAIGDGANDVGMIQEAQVGIGISGLEGQQAVNASDFSIAQFRFLEDLLLVHGRWNFIRLSKTVLYSFYKNAVLACLLMAYCRISFYSGTPVFDMWVLSAFNFVCGWPIIFLGMFDRDLEKDYVKKNPQLYASGPNNEHMSLRTTFRWIALVLIHTNVIYFLCSLCLSVGGSMTTYTKGLMVYHDVPGDGEGGGIKIFGTTIFMVLNWTLGIKVLYESGAIINGNFPSCRKTKNGGFWSRLGYTWFGLIWLSLAFNFFFVYTYQYIGEGGASSFSPFVSVTNHLFHTRSIVWIVIAFVTVAATSIDVIMKVFGNMFYPSQTQIHKEIQKYVYFPQKRREKKSVRFEESSISA